MSEGISFKKPSGFSPFFVAKLKEKRSVRWPLSCIFLLCWVVYDDIENPDMLATSAMLITIFFLVFYISIVICLNKSLNIIEISDKGVWLGMRGIFIPKDRFYKAFKVEESGYRLYLGEVRVKNVHIMFKVTRKERRSLLRRLIPAKIKHKISLTQYQVTQPIPYTIGLEDDIELNVSKTQLINALNSLSDDSAN